MQRIVRIVALAMLAGALCAPASAQLFERTDTQKEIELGRQAAREVEKEIPLSRNAAYQERVKRIGSALVQSLPQKAYPYEFKVLAGSEFNAFCLPGGFMYVYEGLLARLPSDDAVAFVMAHEITHAAHRHWHRIVEKMKGPTILAILADLTTGASDLVSLVHSLIGLQYTREQEDDADRTGVEMAWTAGFDTQGAVQAAEVMADLEKHDHSPEYLRSHPKATDRLKRIETECEALKQRPRPKPKSAAPADDVDLTALFGKLPAADPAPNPWFPLAVGNEWTYAIGGSGKPAYTLRIVSEVKVKGGAAFHAETVLGQGPPVRCQLMTTAGEVWRRNRPALAQSPWRTEYVTMPGQDAPAARDGCTYTLLTPEPLTAPCGAFTDVLRVRKQAGDRTYDLWFARGVGLVKRVCVETGLTETLISYKTR